ncbi:embryonal Fyn-associated substrate, partial [Chanos chanos]|uniref:Embryonal Fyn-associated substrate n=1 Tax=Chanos chanos TaxID=29144 RepID=A0A6J2VWM1_CHACN
LSQTVLAKALFDNTAESPEELAFRKGDILMVLNQDQGGGPGWWLCSLHGRQGIAPANRLRLLQTSPAPAPANANATATDARRAPSVDSVYLSPRDDLDGVYLSPPSLGDGVYQSPGVTPTSRPGELRQSEGGRPRSHSSSGTRPRPDWDVGVTGRPRSPSLRGRGGEPGTVYQTPTSPAPLTAAAYTRSHGALASESVYLTPRPAAEAVADATYLSPREATGSGHSDGCYLVPRPSTTLLPNEELYQTPTSAVSATVPTEAKMQDGTCPKSSPSTSVNGSVPSQSKTGHEPPAMYQTPTPPGGAIQRTPINERKLHRGDSLPAVASPAPVQQRPLPVTARGSPRPLAKVGQKEPGAPFTPPVGRGKLSQGALRGSPLLARAGKAGVPGSPNFGRKPPPPAPPVRSVTRKDAWPSSPTTVTAAPKPVLQGSPAPPQQSREEEERHKGSERCKEVEKSADEKKKDSGTKTKKMEDKEYEDLDGQDQVYDTPPTNRWQRPVPAEEDESIYNTPRTVPVHLNQGSEIYDIPTLGLTPPPVAAAAEVEEEDVYSVPSLPGLPLVTGEIPALTETATGNVLSPGKLEPSLHSNAASEDVSEADGGIYDMPALTLEVPPSSSSRRLSISSTGSADVQWKTSLSALIQSALGSASQSSTLSRDLATSLAEILSAWKAGHAGDAPPPLQQIWSRLSDLLPALSVGGTAPPAEALVSMVQRALEDSALLLQSQERPRLPSQESLSRRPLPALPVAEVKPIAGGMGSRKGSWIQERPLPPPPTAAFPLPPAPVLLPPTVGRTEEDEQVNEYAGIGLTPAPPSYPTGDSVGYVKLQGKPEPHPDAQVESGSTQVITTAETRLSPSPPLPVSLSLEDSELLSFYSSQSRSHLSCLGDSIDALFASVKGNQPPRVFVSKAKSLIVTAHKLVFIGDTLARILSSSDLRAKVTTSSGRLCQALKSVVVATKGAAQNYPSFPATQEMVDRVADLSQHAAGFSGLLQRLAQIS